MAGCSDCQRRDFCWSSSWTCEHYERAHSENYYISSKSRYSTRITKSDDGKKDNKESDDS